MTDRDQLQPSTLMLELTSANQAITTTINIPHQVIRLKSYRVQFDLAATAVANPVVYIDLSGFFSVQHMVDSNLNRLFFPLFISGDAITLETGCDIPISLTKDLPERNFNVRVLNTAFADLTFIRVNLLFEYSLSTSF